MATNARARVRLAHDSVAPAMAGSWNRRDTERLDTLRGCLRERGQRHVRPGEGRVQGGAAPNVPIIEPNTVVFRGCRDVFVAMPYAPRMSDGEAGLKQISDDRASASANAQLHRLSSVESLATVFVTGAAVMAIEILGTRIIGPIFGVTLLVWAALLAVTLASLALGYFLGGLAVDRWPSSRLLGTVIVTAGAFIGLVPLARVSVLRIMEGLGPTEGALLSAALLFAPCLVSLGMVGPVAVRLTAADVRTAGHGTGTVFAVSTAGSLVGTFVTVFMLIPKVETATIVLGVATLVVVVGCISLARHWQRGALGFVMLPLLLSWLVPEPKLPSGIRILDRSQSLYGLVEVIDDTNRDVRLLRADHSIIGAQFVGSRLPAFAFVHVLEAVRCLRPHAHTVLQIGLGAGLLPSALEARGLNVDVVEIDPAVVRFAERYFGFVPNGKIDIEDARTVVRRTERQYDIVVHDTFTGGSVPEHLLSREVIQRIHDVLRPGGILALNFAGYQSGPKAKATWAVARTLLDVFPTLRVVRDSAPNVDPDGAGNLVFFASDAALDFATPDAGLDEECKHIMRTVSAWETLKIVPAGPAITDARNPLARLQVPVEEGHFYAMNRLLPVDVWLQ